MNNPLMNLFNRKLEGPEPFKEKDEIKEAPLSETISKKEAAVQILIELERVKELVYAGLHWGIGIAILFYIDNLLLTAIFMVGGIAYFGWRYNENKKYNEYLKKKYGL